MAPKRKAAQIDLPKKMQELKEYLDANISGRPITTMDIKKANGKLRNQACNAMVHSLAPLQKEAYKRCQNDAKRHEWIKEYLLDPNKVKHEGVTTIRREAVSASKETWVWVTEDELACPR